MLQNLIRDLIDAADRKDIKKLEMTYQQLEKINISRRTANMMAYAVMMETED